MGNTHLCTPPPKLLQKKRIKRCSTTTGLLISQSVLTKSIAGTPQRKINEEPPSVSETEVWIQLETQSFE